MIILALLALGATVEVDGSAKIFPLLSSTPDNAFQESDTDFATIGSFRLNGVAAGEQYIVTAAYHVFPIFGPNQNTAAGPQGGLVAPIQSPLRLFDADREVTSDGDFLLLHNIDRAEVLYFREDGVEFRLGRQAIGHGSARLFSSTDIFSPFSPATLDTEFKQGLDAARVTWPVDEDSEFEVYAVAADADLDRSLERGVYLVRYRQTIPERFDYSVYVGTSYASPTIGLDVSGDIGGATAYAEAFVRAWSNDAAVALGGEADYTVRGTVGAQYFFPFDLDVVLEVHWNGPGATERSGYLETVNRPEWSMGEVYLLGRAYVGSAWSYSTSDLSRLSVSTLHSLVDGSMLLTPSFFWDFATFGSLSVGAILGVGRRLSEELVTDEFGLYPYTVFSDIRVFF
ncbi:MAG: hypothetical protein AAF654_07265 [Myxococcota bacterium]